MAHARTPETPRRSGAAPWAAFVLGMVVILAAIAIFLLATGRAAQPFRSMDLHVQGPSLPEMKMPVAPPMPRG
ncbi:MAG: hypothetical protein EOO78_23725 [Oxalobacteraceae bacterium]|nr:MAG: hypothetical protein EOO78_23725 [Oxalobacteraceae bacterium]